MGRSIERVCRNCREVVVTDRIICPACRGRRYCTICRTPLDGDRGPSNCEVCREALRKARAFHKQGRITPIADLEERIARLRERAARGLPLFERRST